MYLIETIFLEKNNLGYRINVDGQTDPIKNIKLRGKDSLYAFVEITIDPNNALNPFLLEDYLTLSFNSKQQKLPVIAWGQNAYFHQNEAVHQAYWHNDKPHIIIGNLQVGAIGKDSNCVLNIQEGAELFFHNNSQMTVYKSHLNIDGSKENRVKIRNIRKDVSAPGQWNYIHLIKNNASTIKYTDIENGIVGIVVDSTGNSEYALTLENSSINNMGQSSLISRGGSVKAINSSFGNASQESVALTSGGKYQFTHCTLANYWSQTIRNTPCLLLNNIASDKDGNPLEANLVQAEFQNCIIYGKEGNGNTASADEIEINTNGASALNYLFNNCLIESKKFNSQSPLFTNTIFNQSPSFSLPDIGNFILNSDSPAIDTADVNFTVALDINGETRDAKPDIGAYEYFLIEEEME